MRGSNRRPHAHGNSTAKAQNIDSKIFLASACLVGLLMVAWRLTFIKTLNSDLFKRKIILIGRGPIANEIKSEINEKKDCGYSLVSNLHECELNDYNGQNEPALSSDQKYANSLYRSAKRLKADKIIVATDENSQILLLDDLLKCRLDGIDVVEGNRFYEMLTGKVIAKRVNPKWLIFADGFTTSSIMRFIRRSLDLVLSLILIVLSLPLMLVVAILIKSDSDGPIIYSQDR